MPEQPLKVLLVEDNPGDARLVDTMLATLGEGGFTVNHAQRLDQALSMLAEQPFDVVLLDLSLPDSSGMDTVDQTAIKVSEKRIPVIVLTGLLGEQEGLATVEHGAQDYLLKNDLRAESLIRSVRYAVARQRLRLKAEAVAAEQRQDREFESLEKMSAPAAMVTARAFGLERLSESSPDTFELLVEQYTELVEHAIEQRMFRVDGKVSQGLRVMAQRLGFLRAGPRDVVELHIAAVKRKRPVKMTTSYVVAEEARMMLIELMGSLAAYYRSHMVPVGRSKSDGPAETRTKEGPT